jgi:hypothetical protein
MYFEDMGSVFHLTASQVLKLLIRVESASTLADLDNPGPDSLWVALIETA